jgi:SAM-dependent methyltransferase
MQAYGESMALAYDTIWGGYACKAAQEILAYYRRRARTSTAKVLDLCCGAGQLAEIFLKQGYQVTGVDLSDSMLDRARSRCREFISSGKAHFVQSDASSFQVEERFDLAVSTYDALNHLDSIGSLENCFRCVRRAAAPGASFLFDFSTLKGLEEWNRIAISDKDHGAVITRGFFDRQSKKGYKKFTGFLKAGDGTYRRFEEVIFALGYPLAAVGNALRGTGFEDVRITVLGDLEGTSPDPEAEDRVFFVGRTPA